jgi:hypothetical protein
MIQEYLEKQFRNSLPQKVANNPWWMKWSAPDQRVHLYGLYESCLEGHQKTSLESFPPIRSQFVEDLGAVLFVEEKKYFPYKVVFVDKYEHPFILSPDTEDTTR